MKFAIHAAFTAVFSVNLFIELNRPDLSSEECIHTFHTHTRTRHLLEMLWLLKSQCLRLHGQKLWFLFIYNFCHNCQRFMKMFKTLFTSLSLLSQIVLMYLWRSAFYVFVTLSILQPQFTEKGFKKTENSEQNVILLLLLFTLNCFNEGGSCSLGAGAGYWILTSCQPHTVTS